jgi:hypothetical protein
MKRSEAVELIKQIMAANHPLTDHEGCPYVSDEILSALEKAGMLPPETKATPEDFSNLDLHQDFLDEHDFTVNRWDKE